MYILFLRFLFSIESVQVISPRYIFLQFQCVKYTKLVLSSSVPNVNKNRLRMDLHFVIKLVSLVVLAIASGIGQGQSQTGIYSIQKI